jgi:predicted NAD/FAD-binding protein
MRVLVSLSAIVAAILMSCSTVEHGPSIEGASRDEAADIERAVRSTKHAQQVDSIHRLPSGAIIVETDAGDFEAQRVGRRWRFNEVIITGKRT